MKKKVLFVINTMGRAGAERCLLHLFNAWKDEEYELSLFAVLGRGELFLEVPSHVRVLNHNPQVTSVFDKEARKDFFKDILKGMIKNGLLFKEIIPILRLMLWQIKEKKVDIKKLCWKTASDIAPKLEEEFDLAVGYIQGAATYYVMDHVRAKKKILFLHNEYEASGYCPITDGPYYEKANRIYCVSNYIENRLKDVFPSCENKIETMYNFADAQWVKKKAEEGEAPEIKKEPDEICLLTAARLEPVKAFDVGIKAMALLKQRNVKAKWFVLGDGSLHNQLEKEIHEQKLEDCFFLLGQRENPYPYMKACDIYVQETHFEGFSTSITEAVILGKTVVASDCGGNREQLTYYDTGVLTELTPEAIADGIEKAWNNMGTNVDVMGMQRKALERLKKEVG